MNPYTKAALFIIRLVAFAFILFGALPLAANYFTRGQTTQSESLIWIFLEIFALLLGFALLFKSGAIAKKLTEDFDE